LNFDSDQEATTGTPTTAKSEKAPHPPPKDEVPPAKPPRPVSAREQAENTLKEAFPTIEVSVVKAVLAASGGQVEPAFNALLGMTDPDAQQEPPPPAMPPRPPRQQSMPQNQLDTDEQYARQLQEHYANSQGRQQRPNRYNEDLPASRVGRPGSNPNPDDVPWRSFFDGQSLLYGLLSYH
jgi:CUE domain